MSSLPIVFTPDGPVLADPEHGEIYAVADAPAPLVAQAKDDLEEHIRQARDVKALLDAELLARLREARARSMDAGAFRVEANERREWDPDLTWQALTGLLEAGLIDARDADECMPEVTIRKPSGRRLNALLTKLVGDDPESAAPLARARSARPSVKVARVSVDSTATEEVA